MIRHSNDAQQIQMCDAIEQLRAACILHDRNFREELIQAYVERTRVIEGRSQGTR